MKHPNLCAAFFAATVLLMSPGANAQVNGPMGNATMDMTAETHYKSWPKIKEADITRKRRVWEDINVKAQMSPTSVFYAYNGKMPLADVLIKGVTAGKIKAYSNENDRFTRELTKDEFATAYGQTTAKNTEIVKYLVKEDSLYVNTGEIAAIKAADGTITEQTLFWIFYPDTREYLASVPVNGADGWYDIFEKRNYSGSITRLSEGKWADNKSANKQ